MTLYYAIPAYDQNTAGPNPNLAGVQGLIVLEGTTTPTAITDLNGNPFTDSLITITDRFYVPAFRTVEDLQSVDWITPDASSRVHLISEEGMRQDALDAKTAAEAAATNAATEVQTTFQGLTDSASAAASSAAAAQAAAETAEAAVAAAPIALPAGGTTGQVLAKASGADRDVQWTTPGTGDGTGFDGKHSSLSGLDADDHTQYLTAGRGDQRYYKKSEVDAIASTSATLTSGADRDRGNHTGSQAIGTVTGLEGRLAALEAGGGGGGGAITADSISDATAVGKAVLKATSKPNARSAIDAAAAADLAAKADDSAVVHKTGDETVGGTKTFSNPPVVPDAAFAAKKVVGLAPATGSSGKVLTADGSSAGFSWQLPGSDPTGPRTVLAPSAAGIQPWHVALASRHFAPARVAVLGTSNTIGGSLAHWRDLYTQRLQNVLRKQWDCPTGGGLGWIPAISHAGLGGVEILDDVLAITAAGASQYNSGYGYTPLSASGEKLVFTLPAGTSVKVRYRQKGTGVFSWQIDAGAATNVSVSNVAGNAGYLGSLTFSLPSDSASHTVTLAWVSGTVQINGLFHYNGDETSGIQVDNYGQFGSATATYTNDNFAWVLHAADVGYQLIVLEFQGNDIGAGRSAADYKANLTTLMGMYDAQYAAAGKLPPAYLLTSVTPAVTDPGYDASDMALWSAYQVVRNELAAANPTRVASMMLSGWLPVDWTGAPGVTAGVDPTTGMLSNPALVATLFGSGHWNNAGHAMIADTIARFIAGPLGKIG